MATDFAEAVCVWDAGGTLQYETLVLTNDEYPNWGDFVQVKYLVGTETRFWTYEVGSGGIPALDQTLATGSRFAGDYMPMVHFRIDGVSVGSNTSSPQYKASVKMAALMGLDYPSLLSSIEENSGINDVRHALLTMVVPANSSNELELRYLFDFFDQLHVTQQAIWVPTVDPKNIWASAQEALTHKYTVLMRDKAAQIIISMGGVHKQRKVGKIGEIGKHTTSIETLVPTSAAATNGSYLSVSYKVHIYRRQISALMYDEIQVLDLKTSYKVADGEADATGEGNSDVLLIPLDRSLTKEYSLLDRETLYCRSLHIVCVSMHVQTIKWYQQEWFSFVMKVAAIAILIASVGSAYTAAAAAWSAASTITAGIIAVLEVVGLYVIEAVAFNYVLKRVAKAVGVEVTVVLAVIAAVYGSTEALEAGSLAACPFAEQLLTLATGLIKAAASKVSSDIQDLLGEISSLREKYLKDMELLEKTKKLLEQDTTLNPLVILGESPDTYFLRTSHAGNIGVIGLDAVHTYCDRALTLPEFSQTLGGVHHG